MKLKNIIFFFLKKLKKNFFNCVLHYQRPLTAGLLSNDFALKNADVLNGWSLMPNCSRFATKLIYVPDIKFTDFEFFYAYTQCCFRYRNNFNGLYDFENLNTGRPVKFLNWCQLQLKENQKDFDVQIHHRFSKFEVPVVVNLKHIFELFEL